MQNGKFKCPHCKSNSFEHMFPKNKQTPVFLVRCLRCSKYKGWINKSDYKEWINGIKGMEIIKPIVSNCNKY